MIDVQTFRGIQAGDVFYSSGKRFQVVTIEHGETSRNRPQWPFDHVVYHARATAQLQKKTRNGQAYNVLYTWPMLTPGTIEKLVKKDKVRGTRPYKSRRNYPFVQRQDECTLETLETNDCTVRALATMLEIPYAESHAYLKAHGRKDGRGCAERHAYSGLGLTYKPNYTGMTFGQLLKSDKLPTRAIVHTRAHVQTVINGIVHDVGKVGQNSKVHGWYYNA
jgi:hypothetical protein